MRRRGLINEISPPLGGGKRNRRELSAEKQNSTLPPTLNRDPIKWRIKGVAPSSLHENTAPYAHALRLLDDIWPVLTHMLAAERAGKLRVLVGMHFFFDNCQFIEA